MRLMPDLTPAADRTAATGEDIWLLRRRDVTVAEFVITGSDFPWLHANVRPRAGFRELRRLFDDELRLLDHLDADYAAWERAYTRIRRAVSLIAPDGDAVPEFLLHIDGQEAWWRWSDEPFPPQR